MDGDDEGRGAGVGRSGAAEEMGVVVGDQETNEDQGDDVEETDSPEYLLDGCRERTTRVGGLGGCKTNEFCATECECCGDEHGTEASETMVEGSRLIPVLSANVGAVLTAAYVEDYTEDAGDNLVSTDGSESSTA